MKTITFSIDLKSFFVGALTVGGMLLLTNATPASKNDPEPSLLDTRRYQLVATDARTSILDTKTGRMIYGNVLFNQVKWYKVDFEETFQEAAKR